MYLEYFGLREFPFSLAPDPRFLYLSEQHREALAHLLFGVSSEGGFVQLTGEVGTGKTTVCRCFLEQLPPGTRAAVILNPGSPPRSCSPRSATNSRSPAGRPRDREELARSHQPLSARGPRRGRRAVLVIDEAQNLGAAVLEQVRLHQPRDEQSQAAADHPDGPARAARHLARPELRQLAQRITARFHLRPLSREETAAYIRHRLGVAGSREDSSARRCGSCTA